MVVALLFACSRLLFRWRLAFWLVVFAFATLNVANWCSPGWCERFGFPFPYSWWSDSIVIMNGENLTAGASVITFVANLCVLAGVVAVASAERAARRR